MKQFEYKYVRRNEARLISGLAEKAHITEHYRAVFSDLGAAGWELIQVTATGAWLKRQCGNTI